MNKNIEELEEELFPDNATKMVNLRMRKDTRELMERVKEVTGMSYAKIVTLGVNLVANAKGVK